MHGLFTVVLWLVVAMVAGYFTGRAVSLAGRSGQQKSSISWTEVTGAEELGGLLRQDSVDELDGHRSIADGRRNPLQAAGANVPHGEDARQACL